MSKDKEMPEKADLQSLDISTENRAKLKQMFPSVFTETKDEKGELIWSIDFEKLKAELGTFSDVFEARRERYGMDWPGKKDCMKLIQKPSIATLKPCREESVNFDETENLFIEGDNLEVLKLLQKSYYGKIKMIYIDPPYNTGKEFIYPDDYSESLDTYLAYAGLIDNEGKKFSTNTPNEGRFHSRWLNMMYPRLYLAHNLLTETGLIFVSIDDNEVSNLRKLCDEVFGEDCFVADIIWEKRITRENRRFFSVRHDHVLLYVRSPEMISESVGLLAMDEAAKARYKNPDNDPRGPWTSVPAIAQAGHGTKNQFYTLKTPAGKVIDPPSGSCWRYTETKMIEEIKANNIWFGKDGNGVPRIKKFLDKGRQGLTPETIWWAKDVGTNDSAKRALVELFDGIAVFDTPKPVGLIQRMLEIADDKNAIIMDFFAGCAPTADAVITQNAKDGGSRKFIMVQLPEPCDSDSEAAKAGYNTIADIGKERTRRILRKTEEARAVKAKKAKGDLLESQNEPNELDLGLKLLKLDKSNFDVWNGAEPEQTSENLARQLEAFVEHIDPKASQEDILFELLLKAGFKPTEKIEKKEFAGKTVFSIAEGLLLICLEDEITKGLIEAIAEAEPLQFICLDRGFKGNDQLKANAVQTFAARNQGRDKQDQIVFRTV